MLNYIGKLITFIVSIIYVSVGSAQDAHFTQYNHSRLNTNPAYTGCDSTFVISANYRLQWPKLSGTYEFINVSMDKYVRALRGGLGVNYLFDDEADGLYTKSRIELSYAPHFELFKHKLAVNAGIQVGYIQSEIDWSKLTFGDLIDSRRGFVYDSREVPGIEIKKNVDISAGLLLYTNHFFGGIAIHHLTQPDEGFVGPSILPRKITIHGGANLKFKNDLTGKFILSPTLLYMQQQDFQLLMPGITAKYKFISLGVSYRNEDAFIGTVAIQFKNFRLGYSYDYTVSKLTNLATGGTHEVGVSGFIKFKKKKYCKIKTLRLI